MEPPRDQLFGIIFMENPWIMIPKWISWKKKRLRFWQAPQAGGSFPHRNSSCCGLGRWCLWCDLLRRRTERIWAAFKNLTAVVDDKRYFSRGFYMRKFIEDDQNPWANPEISGKFPTIQTSKDFPKISQLIHDLIGGFPGWGAVPANRFNGCNGFNACHGCGACGSAGCNGNGCGNGGGGRRDLSPMEESIIYIIYIDFISLI